MQILPHKDSVSFILVFSCCHVFKMKKKCQKMTKGDGIQGNQMNNNKKLGEKGLNTMTFNLHLI